MQACLRMFLDLDLIGRFHIEYDVLCRWLLSVKKNYRNVTYHNWRHAFNVAQMMFAIVTVRHLYVYSRMYLITPYLWKKGNAVVENIRWDWGLVLDHGLFVPRSGSQRNQQLLSNQVIYSKKETLLLHLVLSDENVEWFPIKGLHRHLPNCTRLRPWNVTISINVWWFWVAK